MNDNKRPETDTSESGISSETPENISLQQRPKQKSKQKEYPKEDKSRTARQEHTNGSTPKSRL
jgi:hypothetical protein